MFRRSTSNYDRLYARQIEGVGEFLDFGRYDPKCSLLDLCGGTGALAKEAVRRGATDVTIFDLEPRCDAAGVQTIRGDFNIAHDRDKLRRYDFIFCRQAISFLDLDVLANELPNLLTPGGRFIVDAPADDAPKQRSYERGGTQFLEFDFNIGRWHFHLQRGHGVGTDLLISKNIQASRVFATVLPLAARFKRQFTNESVWIMAEMPFSATRQSARD